MLIFFPASGCQGESVDGTRNIMLTSCPVKNHENRTSNEPFVIENLILSPITNFMRYILTFINTI